MRMFLAFLAPFEQLDFPADSPYAPGSNTRFFVCPNDGRVWQILLVHQWVPISLRRRSLCVENTHPACPLCTARQRTTDSATRSASRLAIIHHPCIPCRTYSTYPHRHWAALSYRHSQSSVASTSTYNPINLTHTVTSRPYYMIEICSPIAFKPKYPINLEMNYTGTLSPTSHTSTLF